MASKRARVASLRRAAKSAAEAQRALTAAQRVLASVSQPGDADAFLDAAFAGYRAVLDRHAARLKAVPGVIGVGIGLRQRRQTQLAEPCLIVFVRRKLTPGSLAKAGRRLLPRTLAGPSGRRLPVDVRQLGPLTRLFAPGELIAPCGSSRRGTLGTSALDRVSGDKVVLTAMHLTGRKEFPPGSPIPFCVGPSGHLLGHVSRGTQLGVDAAVITLAKPGSVSPEIPGIGRIRGWRPMALPADIGAPIRMFGAASGFSAGIITDPVVSLPQYGLDSAILGRLPCAPGDSGAAILDGGNHIVGLLVGMDRMGTTVMCAIGSVLYLLGCDISDDQEAP